MVKDTFAIIKTGGKQYRVREGTRLKIEKLLEEVGADISFDRVLLVNKDGAVAVGTPTVEGVSVQARIIEQGRHAKQIIFKMRPKKRYRVKNGHRQTYTEVEIMKI